MPARHLARQRELGFDVFTDGELRRRNFMSDFTDAVEGFDMGDAVGAPGRRARPGRAGAAAWPASSPASSRGARRLTGHELPFLKAH